MKNKVGRPKGKKKFTCSFALSRELIDRLHDYCEETGRKNKSESVEFLLGQVFAIMDGESFEAKFPDYAVMPKRDAEFDYDPRDILP
jgi:hypothetical protein